MKSILVKNNSFSGEMTRESLAMEAFKEMDTNTDGKVTEEEFVRACLGHETISTMLALKIVDVFI